MRDGWTETTLGDVVVLKPGKYIAKESYVADGKYWIYGSNSVMGRYSEALVSKPHVVMAAIGAYAGAVRHSENPSWVNNNAFALIPNSQLLSGWLFYWLDTCLEISSVVVGTGQPYVQRPALMNQVFRLPPIEEQRRIVDVVGSVDAYIDALKDKVAKARTARNAVLHELLSAGGPDWTETTLGEISELISRGRAPSYCEEGGVMVLNQKCVRGGRIHVEFARLTDVAVKSIPDWAYLKPGDSLINSTGVGTLGRASFVPELGIPATFDSHLTVVRPRSDKCVPSFVGLCLNYREHEIEMFAGGSTGQTELSRDAVRSIPLVLPPLEEQRRIVDIVSSMDDVIAASEKAVAEAVRLRSGLLSDLLSGEHEIPSSYDSLLGAA